MVTFIIAVAYILSTFIVGILSNRKSKNIQHFLVAQGQLNLPLCAALLLASTFAGAYTTGSARDSYLTGFAPYLPIAALGAAYLIFIPMVRPARALGRAGFISVPDFFSVRFGKSVGKVVTVVNCIEYGALFAVQPIAFASIVSPMLGVPAEKIVWVAAAILTLLAMMGLTGVAWMNAIHCLTMILGMTIVSIVAMVRAGGISNIVSVVSPETWNVFSPDIGTSLAYFISTMFYSYCASETYTAAMSAKKGNSARTSCWVVGIIVFIFTAFLMMIGISARVLLPGIENASSVLFSLTERLGPVFMVCGSIAVMAAIASSAPAYLIYFSTNITQEVFSHSKNGEEIGETKKRVFSSAVIIVLAVVGTFLAQKATSILYLLFNVTTVQSFSGFVLCIGMIWKRVSEKAALISISVASLCGFVWMFLGNPFDIIPAFIAFGIGGILLVALTLTEKKKRSEGAEKMITLVNKYTDE